MCVIEEFHSNSGAVPQTTRVQDLSDKHQGSENSSLFFYISIRPAVIEHSLQGFVLCDEVKNTHIAFFHM